MAGRRWVGKTGLPLSLLALAHFLPGPTARLAAQTTTVQGWLTSVFTEAEPPAPPLRYIFSEAGGRRLELLLDASTARAIGGAALRQGFRAEVEVEARSAAVRTPPSNATPVHRAIRVTRLSPPAAESRALALTTYPYVTILCRFSDISSEPFQPAQVQSRMGSSYPGANHYFQELSEGQASLAGSITVGWYVLPKPRSQYISGASIDFGAITTDCTGAADADVFFPQYQGVILQFNAGLSVRSVAPYDTLSFGGSYALSRDGSFRSYPMVWMSREHVDNYVVLHHELGHSLGWPHSSGPYAQTYDSRWDIMSRGYIYQDPTYGYLGPHTIAYHKDLAGWLPPARLWRFGAGDPASFLLLRTALPPTGPGYQAAMLPIPGTAKHLTVESRLIAGYDRGFPGEGVLIHEVDPSRWDRTAQVIDPDDNGDPNDAAAIWVPGERYVDPASGYTVQVDSASPAGFWVTVGDRSHALASSARSDSALVGDTAIRLDSVGLRVFGAESLTAAWTVGHRAGAPWVRLLTTSGQGSGVIRWERDPAGLPVGVHVDTLSVHLPGSVTGTPYLVDSFHVLPPLSVALVPGSLRDSAPQGRAAPLTASAQVTLAGFGGHVAPWSASHGAAPWVTLETPDGNGSGPLTWSRNASGLAPGVYVDTLRVTAAGASGSPAAVIDSLVVYEPQIAVQCATSVLLSGGGCLGSVGADYLDRTGNRDGSYDLGDLLAYLDRKGLPLPSSAAMRGQSLGGAARRPELDAKVRR